MVSLRGEDKGEGEITTLSIVDCRLRIGKTKTTSNQQQTNSKKQVTIEMYLEKMANSANI